MDLGITIIKAKEEPTQPVSSSSCSHVSATPQKKCPDYEELNNLEYHTLPTMYHLRTNYTTEEKEILKTVVKEFAYPLVSSARKTWDSSKLWYGILTKYNQEIGIQVPEGPTYESKTKRTMFELLDMARITSWCTCSENSKVLCTCVEPKLPESNSLFGDSPSLSNSGKSLSNSGVSRKRSYESISSSSLTGRVASIINMLTSRKYMTQGKGQDVANLYSIMINNGLEVNVEWFCQAANGNVQDLLKHIDEDMKKCGDRYLL